MNFFDIRQIKQFLANLNRLPDSRFEPITLNQFEIQVQAGERTFSLPFVDFVSLGHYTHVQVFIYEILKGEETTISPLNDERFKKYSWAKYFQYIDYQGKALASYSGKEIPLDETCHLIRDVYKTSRLKMFY